MEIFQLFIAAVFVNNIVLAQYLGNCPYLGCSKERGVALGMGSAVIFVIVVSTFEGMNDLQDIFLPTAGGLEK